MIQDPRPRKEGSPIFSRVVVGRNGVALKITPCLLYPPKADIGYQ
jgi:hypothetical protein